MIRRSKRIRRLCSPGNSLARHEKSRRAGAIDVGGSRRSVVVVVVVEERERKTTTTQRLVPERGIGALPLRKLSKPRKLSESVREKKKMRQRHRGQKWKKKLLRFFSVSLSRVARRRTKSIASRGPFLARLPELRSLSTHVEKQKKRKVTPTCLEKKSALSAFEDDVSRSSGHRAPPGRTFLSLSPSPLVAFAPSLLRSEGRRGFVAAASGDRR